MDTALSLGNSPQVSADAVQTGFSFTARPFPSGAGILPLLLYSQLLPAVNPPGRFRSCKYLHFIHIWLLTKNAKWRMLNLALKEQEC